MITYTPKWGVGIEYAAGEAIALCSRQNEAVLLQFNHKEIVVNNFSSIESIVCEYYREDIQKDKPVEDIKKDISKMEDSPADASQCLLEALAPLCAASWTKDDYHPDIINGNWAEDYKPYEIKAPEQLVDAIIKMQNYICENYIYLQEHKAAIDAIEARFTSCGANPAEL